MNTSLFELFKIGIGPSSSHTVGPMRAALRFLRELDARQLFDKVDSITVDLYGSLALTGHGHGTDRAVLLGLLGESPDTVPLDQIESMLERVRSEHKLRLMGRRDVAFRESEQLRFHREQMYPDPQHATHPNGMRFTVFDAAGNVVARDVFYSVGGGFILSAAELEQSGSSAGTKRDVPYPFSSAAELLRLGEERGLSITEMILRNEIALLNDPTITRRIDRIVSPARP